VTPPASRRDYAPLSFWLETAGDDLTPRAPLDGSIDADVAVLGAGYTGLWTAYYLLKRNPALRVAVMEKEIAGFGASGRNGGWCSARLNVSPELLAERHGAAATRALLEALRGSIEEIGRVCDAEGIDAGFARRGALFVARWPHEAPAMREYAAAYERLGLGGNIRLLDAAETARRVRVHGALGAFSSPDYATVHPGRLVRGLARAVERLGATIYEETPVTGYTTGRKPSLRTPGGDVRAATIVLAGEAYLTRLPRLRRALLPIYSLIVLTEPLSETHWAEIGWQGRECLASFRLTVDYLTRTADGRILFGGRGAPYHFGSGIADAFDRDEATHEMLRRMAREWFPCLAGVRFTHAWGGPVGIPRDWTPTISLDRSAGLATARGYTGHGVALSNLAGRTLADLISGTESPLTALPLVGHRSPDWEPEPLRWLAVRYIQEAYSRLDTRGEQTGIPPTGRTLAERLGRH
jgi:glycine/D-amino acid oxidase-like deaminating enzyme